jgi:hypothetical protein
MKKLIFLMLLSVGAYAQTVHRVTNGMNLQTVIDNAASGDVILVEGGGYGNIEINKSLFIYGTGYFLNNVNLLNEGVSVLGEISITANSVVFQGFKCGNITVLANNVLIKRNHSLRINVGGDAATGISPFQSNNVQVIQNLAKSFGIYGESINFNVFNNILYESGGNSGFTLGTSGFGEIKNNTFLNTGYGYGYYPWFKDYSNTQFINNIFPSILNNVGSRTNIMHYIRPYVLEYNLFTDTFQNTSLTNIMGVDINSIYQAYSTNPNNLQEDARYQLAPNSPARGAGENGTDCGAFGGDDPYVLSGIPDIPSIYQLTVPSQVPQNGTLNVQIKAKTNN